MARIANNSKIINKAAQESYIGLYGKVI